MHKTQALRIYSRSYLILEDTRLKEGFEVLHMTPVPTLYLREWCLEEVSKKNVAKPP